jgi:hypothetical protein
MLLQIFNIYKIYFSRLMANLDKTSPTVYFPAIHASKRRTRAFTGAAVGASETPIAPNRG